MNNEKRDNIFPLSFIDDSYDKELVSFINSLSEEVQRFFEGQTITEMHKIIKTAVSEETKIKTKINELISSKQYDNINEIISTNDYGINYFKSLHQELTKNAKNLQIFSDRTKLLFKTIKLKRKSKIEEYLLTEKNKLNFQSNSHYDNCLTFTNNNSQSIHLSNKKTTNDINTTNSSIILAEKVLSFLKQIVELQEGVLKHEDNIIEKKKLFEITKDNLMKNAQDIISEENCKGDSFSFCREKETIERLKKEIEELKKENDKYKISIEFINAQKEEEAKSNELALTSLKNEITELNKKINTIPNEYNNTKIQNDIQSARDILVSLQEKNQTLLTDNEELKEQNEALTKQINEHMDNFSKLRKLYSENETNYLEKIQEETNKNVILTSQITMLKQSQSTQKHERESSDSLFNNKVVELEKEKNELANENKEYLSQIENLKEQLIKTEKDLNELNETITQKQKQIDDNANDKTKNEQLISEYKSQIEKYEARLKSAIENENNLICSLDKKQSDVMLNFNKKLQEKTELIEELTTKNKEQSSLIEQMKTENKTQKDSYQEILIKLEHQNNVNTNLFKTINQLNEQISKLENENNITKVSLIQKEKEIKEVNEEVNEYKISIEQKEKTIKDLNNQINTIKEEYNTEKMIIESEYQKEIKNKNEPIITPDLYNIITDKTYKSHTWYLLQNKSINDSFIWVAQSKIDINLYNKFIGEKEEMEKINNKFKEFTMKLEEKENIIYSLEEQIKKEKSQREITKQNILNHSENMQKETIISELNSLSYGQENCKTINEIKLEQEKNKIIEKLNEKDKIIENLKEEKKKIEKKFQETVQLENNCSFIKEGGDSPFLEKEDKEAISSINDDKSKKGHSQIQCNYIDTIKRYKEDLFNAHEQLKMLKGIIKNQNAKIIDYQEKIKEKETIISTIKLKIIKIFKEIPIEQKIKEEVRNLCVILDIKEINC